VQQALRVDSVVYHVEGRDHVVGLGLPALFLFIDLGVCGSGSPWLAITLGEDTPGSTSPAPGAFDPEVPSVAVVEQEPEPLARRRVADWKTAGQPRPSASAAKRQLVRRDAGVLARPVPRLAAEEERPQMVAVELERGRDHLAEVIERLVAAQLDIPPDALGAREGVGPARTSASAIHSAAIPSSGRVGAVGYTFIASPPARRAAWAVLAQASGRMARPPNSDPRFTDVRHSHVPRLRGARRGERPRPSP
jgi:hypothetical protein